MKFDEADHRILTVRSRLGTSASSYTGDVLRDLANGPILDPVNTALPAGKCSVAEMRRRER